MEKMFLGKRSQSLKRPWHQTVSPSIILNYRISIKLHENPIWGSDLWWCKEIILNVVSVEFLPLKTHQLNCILITSNHGQEVERLRLIICKPYAANAISERAIWNRIIVLGFIEISSIIQVASIIDYQPVIHSDLHCRGRIERPLKNQIQDTWIWNTLLLFSVPQL